MSLKNDQKLKEQTQLALNLLQRKFRLVSKKTSPIIVGVYWDDLKSYELTPKVFAEAVCLLEEYGLKITGNYDEDALSDYSASGEGEEPTCFDILLPPEFELVYKTILGDDSAESGRKLRFDGGTLRYGDISHSFHRGPRGDGDRLKLFKTLWTNRLYSKKGTNRTTGKILQPGHLASQLEIVMDTSSFVRNKKPRDKFFALIKGINRILKGKKIPARIERRGGIQLVVKE